MAQLIAHHALQSGAAVAAVYDHDLGYLLRRPGEQQLKLALGVGAPHAVNVGFDGKSVSFSSISLFSR